MSERGRVADRFSIRLYRAAFFAASLVLLLCTACEQPPECMPGQMKYEGRPPRQLFAYDSSCRNDCFSLPAQKAGKARCDPSCEPVGVKQPSGTLFGDRTLLLYDLDSLRDSRALIFSFGFVDEAGGEAPDDWGMAAVGPRTYLSDRIDGTARFFMEVGVAEFEPNGQDLLVIVEQLSELMSADPGRLEILHASEDRLAGRFFLGYQTSTAQPQGEVIGCFDLSLSEVRDSGGVSYQSLTQ